MMAKKELKLFNFRSIRIIFKNFLYNFSRSCCRCSLITNVLTQNDMSLK